MKSTILSEKDSKLLEKAILQYGRIATIADLLDTFKTNYSTASAYKRISLLTHSGWLRRIKKGLYLIIDSLSGRSQIDISLLQIANTLIPESYVSLSYALNYYQMFDQYSSTIVSVTKDGSKKYIVDNYIFKFSKVKKDMYFGFAEKLEGGKLVRVADPEKALIDYLYLDKSFGSASLVFEKLRNHSQELDITRLQAYALQSSIAAKRKIGFMLDQLKIESNTLYQAVQNNRSASSFTKDSQVFNAKWRIYYDNRIIG